MLLRRRMSKGKTEYNYLAGCKYALYGSTDGVNFVKLLDLWDKFYDHWYVDSIFMEGGYIFTRGKNGNNNSSGCLVRMSRDLQTVEIRDDVENGFLRKVDSMYFNGYSSLYVGFTKSLNNWFETGRYERTLPDFGQYPPYPIQYDDVTKSMVYIKSNRFIATFPNIYTGVNYDETVYYFNYVGLPETDERPDYKRINKVLLIDNNLFAITYYSDYFFECDMANIEGRYLPTKYDPKSDLNRAFGFVEMIKDGVKYINVYTDWHETINGESVPVIQCYTRRADDTFGDFTSLGSVLVLPKGWMAYNATIFKAGDIVYISNVSDSNYTKYTYYSYDYITWHPVTGIYEGAYYTILSTIIHLETPLVL